MSDKLTSKQIDDFKEAFSKFDSDDDGSITIKELREVLKFLGEVLDDGELRDLVKEVDSDSTGYIDFHEFLTAMARKIIERESVDEVLDAFKIFDADNNGYISTEEFRKIMTTMGEKMTDDEVDEMIRFADVDGDGHINYEEFANIITDK